MTLKFFFSLLLTKNVLVVFVAIIPIHFLAKNIAESFSYLYSYLMSVIIHSSCLVLGFSAS